MYGWYFIHTLRVLGCPACCMDFFRLGAFPAGAELCFLFNNQGSSRIAFKGSGIAFLQLMAMQLYFLCVHYLKPASVRFLWAPHTSDMVVVADYLGKMEDPCDYMLSEEVFAYLCYHFGAFMINRAASREMCQVFSGSVPIFNSRMACLGTSGAEFQSQWDWARHFNYVFLPFFLVPAALYMLRSQSTTGVVLMPDWPLAWWSPLMCHGTHDYADEWSLPSHMGLLSLRGIPVLLPCWRIRAVKFDFRLCWSIFFMSLYVLVPCLSPRWGLCVGVGFGRPSPCLAAHCGSMTPLWNVTPDPPLVAMGASSHWRVAL